LVVLLVLVVVPKFEKVNIKKHVKTLITSKK